MVLGLQSFKDTMKAMLKQISLTVIAWLILQLGKGFLIASHALMTASDWLYAKAGNA